MRALAIVFALLAAPAGADETHLLVVCGLGGEPRYADAFHEWASSLVDAASRAGLSPGSVVYLGEKPERDPSRIDGPSTREGISRALGDLQARVRPGDTVLVLLIGHGSAQSGEARFNLPGPDLTGSELARLLEPFREQRLAVVNAASGSGDFARALAAPGRIVITACKGGERNETVFGKYFVEALARPGADIDKDGRVSLLEAFQYARRQVARFYEGDNRLQTEHALLEDDGDGVGSAEPRASSGDGAVASRIFLEGRALATAGADAGPTTLDEEARRIEEKIAALKARKEGLAPEEYQRELEDLLVALAEKTRALREKKQP